MSTTAKKQAVVKAISNENPQAVRIALTQVNKNGRVNSSFTFTAQGFDLSDFLTGTCQKIVKVMELQKRIRENKGRSNAFGLTKSGEFELSVTTSTDDGQTKLLNNFVFTLGQLGEENPEAVLIDLVEGYKLLTE